MAWGPTPTLDHDCITRPSPLRATRSGSGSGMAWGPAPTLDHDCITRPSPLRATRSGSGSGMPGPARGRPLRRPRACQYVGALLGLEHQLCGKQAMLLRHGRFGAIDDVVDDLAAVRQLDVARLDVAGGFVVRDEQVAAARASCDVDVLADFDEAVGAEDRQPPITPRRQAVRREPVDADVPRAAIAAHQHVAEILEIGVLRVVQIADLRGDDLGLCRSGEEEELVGLVRCDVAQDAAVAGTVEES